MPGTREPDESLLDEQRAFYRADAKPFDSWLSSLLDETNDEPVAQGYRRSLALIRSVFEQMAPLGDVLEIAAGTGVLAPTYLPSAASAVLLDTSPESLELAADRLADHRNWRTLCADAFDATTAGGPYDTIIFSSWLHHVPHDHFDRFWRVVDTLLTNGGTVIFDYQLADIATGAEPDLAEEPTHDYRAYQPQDGISIRDHLGKRWRVVHNLWNPDELATQLASIGWTTTDLGQGLFNHMRWIRARRSA